VLIRRLKQVEAATEVCVQSGTLVTNAICILNDQRVLERCALPNSAVLIICTYTPRQVLQPLSGH
jgi:Yos1-like